MHNLPDEEIVKQCLEGNKDAFAEIIDRYQRQIYNLSYKLTNNSEDAVDLSQEIFLHLYRVLNKFDCEKKFFSWMYQVAMNIGYNYLKKRPSELCSIEEENTADNIAVSAEALPEEIFQRREVQSIIKQTIADLPENYRIVVYLRYMEDMSYKEIAEKLILPMTTVETRIHRGRKMLRDKLSKVLERN